MNWAEARVRTRLTGPLTGTRRRRRPAETWQRQGWAAAAAAAREVAACTA